MNLLGSLLIQWIIVRINERELGTKTELIGTPRRSFATLRRRGSPRRSMLRLGGPESSENLTSISPRRRCLRLGSTPKHRVVEQKQK